MKIQPIEFPLGIGTADELRVYVREDLETENSITIHYALLDTDQTTHITDEQQIPSKTLYSNKLIVTGNDYVSYKVDSNYINELVVNLLGVTVIPEE